MANILSAPKDIQLPQIDYAKDTRDEWTRKEQEYLDKLRAALQKRKPNDPHVGEVVRWPCADGYAQYMVASLIGKVELVHLELGDAWVYPDDHLQNRTSILAKIRQQRAMAELFSRKK